MARVEFTIREDEETQFDALHDDDYEGPGKQFLARAFFRYGMFHHEKAWQLAGQSGADRHQRRTKSKT